MEQEYEQMHWSREQSEEPEFPMGLAGYRLDSERGEPAELGNCRASNRDSTEIAVLSVRELKLSCLPSSYEINS